MVGKTNMDQFAAGLVGTRTPYGVAANAFDARFVPGGSSSGSGAIVGARLLTFALGTDTAGSGKVVSQLLQGSDQQPPIGLAVDHPPPQSRTQPACVMGNRSATKQSYISSQLCRQC